MGDDTAEERTSFDPEQEPPPAQECSQCHRPLTAVAQRWRSSHREDEVRFFPFRCLVCDGWQTVFFVWWAGRWHAVDDEFSRSRPAGRSRAGAFVASLLELSATMPPSRSLVPEHEAVDLWDEVMDLGWGRRDVRIWLLALRNPDIGLPGARRYVAAHEDATGWEAVPWPLPPMREWGHESERLTAARAELSSLLTAAVPQVAPDGSATVGTSTWFASGRLGGTWVALGPRRAPLCTWDVDDDPGVPPQPQVVHPPPGDALEDQLARYLTELDPAVHALAADGWRTVDSTRGKPPYGSDDFVPAREVRQHLRAIERATERLHAALAAPDVRAVRAQQVGLWEDPLLMRTADRTRDPSWTVLPSDPPPLDPDPARRWWRRS